MNISFRNMLATGLVALVGCSTLQTPSDASKVKELYPMQPQVALKNESDNSKRIFNVSSFKKQGNVYLVERNAVPYTDELSFVIRKLDDAVIKESDKGKNRFSLESTVYVSQIMTNPITELPYRGVKLEDKGTEGIKATRSVIPDSKKNDGYELGKKIEVSLTSTLKRVNFDGKTYILPLTDSNVPNTLPFVALQDNNRSYLTNGIIEVNPGKVYRFILDANYSLRVPSTNAIPTTNKVNKVEGQIIDFN